MTGSQPDILVIGAGIAGASAAAELARTHRVLLLEREDSPGYHSTGRSAAVFSEIYGNERRARPVAGEPRFLYRPPADFSPDPLVKRRSWLHVASESQAPHSSASLANEDLAPRVRRIRPEDALALSPLLRPDTAAAGGAYEDGCRRRRRACAASGLSAPVPPPRRHACDRRACRRPSAHAAVSGASRARPENFSARIVINAAGAWADTIASKAGSTPHADPAMPPHGRSGRAAGGRDLPDAWPLVIDIDETFYFKPDAGLLLVSPADETPVAPCDVQPEEIDVAIAIDRVEKATTLNVTRVRTRWAGLRSFAPDRSPVIGFDGAAPGFFWLAGQGGYGIQTAPAASPLRGRPGARRAATPAT